MAVTVTSQTLQGLRLQKYTLAWVANSAGAVSETLDIKPGEIRQVKFIPDSGGTQPTAAYDVTLVDENGVDMLSGDGTDLSNSASMIVARQSTPKLHDGTQRLTLTVANAGAANGGTVILWIGSSRNWS